MTTSFSDLGVRPELVSRLRARGIESAFPIQVATLPDALAGRDVCGRAPTGSGKTLAFGLAVVERCTGSAPWKPRGLILAPTRELASQIEREIALVSGDGRRVISIYGGTSYGPTRKSLSKGVDIVVACPGRLEDLVEQGAIDLSAVQTIVVDEADRMADMGFLPAVRRLMDLAPDKCQVLLFSATLGPEIEALVKQYQHEPVRHDVALEDDALEVDHHFWLSAREQRVGLTAQLVSQHGRALVFCRTRHGVDRLAKQLKSEGIEAAAIHGDRTQAQRERALSAFSRGQASALVATDVAARGIHVEDLPCVVHFDLPIDPTDYLHRSGRTGRAGKTGTVVSLVTSEQQKVARNLQRTLGLGSTEPAPPITAMPRPARPAVVREDSFADGHSGRRNDGDRFDEGRHEGRPERPSGRRPERNDRTSPRRDRPVPARQRDDWRTDGPRGERSDSRPARDVQRSGKTEWRTDTPRSDGRPARAPRTGRDAWRSEGRADTRASHGEWRPEVRSGARPDRGQRNDAQPDGRPQKDEWNREERPARPRRNPGSERRNGAPVATVKFYNAERGFGFLATPDGDDLFVHYSHIYGFGPRSLEVGQKVAFEVAPGRKGSEARNVRLV